MTMEKALILNGYKNRNEFSLWYLLYGKDGLEEFFAKYPAEKISIGKHSLRPSEIMDILSEDPESFLSSQTVEEILEKDPVLIQIIDEKNAEKYVTTKSLPFLNHVPDHLFGDYLKSKDAFCITDEEYFQATNEQLEQCFKEHSSILENIPEKRWDADLLSRAMGTLMDIDMSVAYGIKIPEGLKTEKYWRVLCTVNGYYFRLLPEEYKYILTEDFVLHAMQNNRSYVGFLHMYEAIPEELKTEKVSLLACINHFAAAEDLPERFRNDEFYNKLIEFGQYHFLGYIKLDTISAEVFEKVLSKCEPGYSPLSTIKKIPAHLLTKGVIHQLAVHGEESLVPAKYKDKDFYLTYVRYHGGNLDKVPEKYMNEEVCLSALEGNAYAARKHIPESIKTDDFWEKVVEKRLFYSPADLPEKYCTEELVLENATCIDDIPEKFLNDITVIPVLKKQKWVAPIDLKKYQSQAIYDYVMGTCQEKMYVYYLKLFRKEFWKREHIDYVLQHDPESITIQELEEQDIRKSLEYYPENIIFAPDGYTIPDQTLQDEEIDSSIDKDSAEASVAASFTQLNIFDFLTA